jgi:hypothetical protein
VLYLDDHEADRDDPAGLRIALETLVGSEQEGDEDAQHDHVLDAEAALVDHHRYPATPQHHREHQSEEAQEGQTYPVHHRRTNALPTTSTQGYLPPELEGQAIQSKWFLKPSQLLMRKNSRMAGTVNTTTTKR